MQAIPTETPSRGRAVLIGALSLLVAAALILNGLNAFSMWFDEIRMLQASLDWNPLDLSTWAFRSGHPPGYFILLRGWIMLGGQDDFSLRLFSGLLGVLAAALIVRVGKDLSGSLFGGIAAALLFAAMGFVRYYIHETHNYALLLLACMALLFFYERWWRHPGRRVYVIGAILATAAIMYTHYYGVFFILALNLFVVIANWRRVREIWRWFGYMALAAVLYIPMIGLILPVAQRIIDRFILKQTGGKAARGEDRINSALTTNWKTVGMTIEALLADQLVVFGILAALAVIGAVLLVRARRDRDRQSTVNTILLLVIMVVGSVAIALFVNLFYRTFTFRRVIYVLPPLALLLGVMLAGLPKLIREGVLVAAVGLIFAGGYGTQYLPGDWGFRQMIQTVAKDYRSGDLVYLQVPAQSLPGLPLTYYAETLLPEQAAVMTLEEGGLETPDSRAYFAEHVFGPRALARDNFWVISATDPVYGATSLAWVGDLNRVFQPATPSRIGLFNVTRYAALPQRRGTLEGGIDLSSPLGLPLNVGETQFELDRVQVFPITTRPGDTLIIWLDWRALRPPSQDYAIYVHLFNGDDLVAQQDGDPLHFRQPIPTSLWPVGLLVFDERRLTLPADLPEGDYRLVIGMYDRATLAQLQVEPSEAKIGGVVLQDIKVTRP